MFDQEKFSIQIIALTTKPFTNIQRDKSAIEFFLQYCKQILSAVMVYKNRLIKAKYHFVSGKLSADCKQMW